MIGDLNKTRRASCGGKKGREPCSKTFGKKPDNHSMEYLFEKRLTPEQVGKRIKDTGIVGIGGKSIMKVKGQLQYKN